MNRSLVWQVENVLSYDKTLGNTASGYIWDKSVPGNKGQNLAAQTATSRKNTLIKPNLGFALGPRNIKQQACIFTSPHRLSSQFAVSATTTANVYDPATVRRDGFVQLRSNNLYAIFPRHPLVNFTNDTFLKNVPIG
jgi:hypothetical protein